jgi:hypothetical protein
MTKEQSELRKECNEAIDRVMMLDAKVAKARKALEEIEDEYADAVRWNKAVKNDYNAKYQEV